MKDSALRIPGVGIKEKLLRFSDQAREEILEVINTAATSQGDRQRGRQGVAKRVVMALSYYYDSVEKIIAEESSGVVSSDDKQAMIQLLFCATTAALIKVSQKSQELEIKKEKTKAACGDIEEKIYEDFQNAIQSSLACSRKIGNTEGVVRSAIKNVEFLYPKMHDNQPEDPSQIDLKKRYNKIFKKLKNLPEDHRSVSPAPVVGVLLDQLYRYGDRVFSSRAISNFKLEYESLLKSDEADNVNEQIKILERLVHNLGSRRPHRSNDLERMTKEIVSVISGVKSIMKFHGLDAPRFNFGVHEAYFKCCASVLDIVAVTLFDHEQRDLTHFNRMHKANLLSLANIVGACAMNDANVSPIASDMLMLRGLEMFLREDILGDYYVARKSPEGIEKKATSSLNETADSARNSFISSYQDVSANIEKVTSKIEGIQAMLKCLVQNEYGDTAVVAMVNKIDKEVQEVKKITFPEINNFCDKLEESAKLFNGTITSDLIIEAVTQMRLKISKLNLAVIQLGIGVKKMHTLSAQGRTNPPAFKMVKHGLGNSIIFNTEWLKSQLVGDEKQKGRYCYEFINSTLLPYVEKKRMLDWLDVLDRKKASILVGTIAGEDVTKEIVDLSKDLGLFKEKITLFNSNFVANNDLRLQKLVLETCDRSLKELQVLKSGLNDSHGRASLIELLNGINFQSGPARSKIMLEKYDAIVDGLSVALPEQDRKVADLDGLLNQLNEDVELIRDACNGVEFSGYDATYKNFYRNDAEMEFAVNNLCSHVHALLGEFNSVVQQEKVIEASEILNILKYLDKEGFVEAVKEDVGTSTEALDGLSVPGSTGLDMARYRGSNNVPGEGLLGAHTLSSLAAALSNHLGLLAGLSVGAVANIDAIMGIPDLIKGFGDFKDMLDYTMSGVSLDLQGIFPSAPPVVLPKVADVTVASFSAAPPVVLPKVAEVEIPVASFPSPAPPITSLMQDKLLSNTRDTASAPNVGGALDHLDENLSRLAADFNIDKMVDWIITIAILEGAEQISFIAFRVILAYLTYKQKKALLEDIAAMRGMTEEVSRSADAMIRKIAEINKHLEKDPLDDAVFFESRLFSPVSGLKDMDAAGVLREIIVEDRRFTELKKEIRLDLQFYGMENFHLSELDAPGVARNLSVMQEYGGMQRHPGVARSLFSKVLPIRRFGDKSVISPSNLNNLGSTASGGLSENADLVAESYKNLFSLAVVSQRLDKVQGSMSSLYSLLNYRESIKKRIKSQEELIVLGSIVPEAGELANSAFSSSDEAMEADLFRARKSLANVDAGIKKEILSLATELHLQKPLLKDTLFSDNFLENLSDVVHAMRSECRARFKEFRHHKKELEEKSILITKTEEKTLNRSVMASKFADWESPYSVARDGKMLPGASWVGTVGSSGKLASVEVRPVADQKSSFQDRSFIALKASKDAIKKDKKRKTKFMKEKLEKDLAMGRYGVL